MKFSPENREKVMTRTEEWVKELKQNSKKCGRVLRLQDEIGTACNMIGKNGGFIL